MNWSPRIHLFPADPAFKGPGKEMDLSHLEPGERLSFLHDQGVTTLICGALTPDLLHQGKRLGLVIICGVAGEVREVLNSYWENRLDQPRFRLPGCRAARRYRRHLGGEHCFSIPGDQGVEVALRGGGRKGGRSQGGKSSGRRRVGGCGPGAPGAGPGLGLSDFCVCPACGAKAPHERGIPCLQVPCPQCGKPMVRE